MPEARKNPIKRGIEKASWLGGNPKCMIIHVYFIMPGSKKFKQLENTSCGEQCRTGCSNARNGEWHVKHSTWSGLWKHPTRECSWVLFLPLENSLSRCSIQDSAAGAGGSVASPLLRKIKTNPAEHRPEARMLWQQQVLGMRCWSWLQLKILLKNHIYHESSQEPWRQTRSSLMKLCNLIKTTSNCGKANWMRN